MHSLEQKVRNYIIKNNMFDFSTPIIVGVSGGADSICLAVLLKKMGYQIIVAHINHNLRGDEAKRDEDFVRDFAKDNNVQFELLSADINNLANEKKISCEMAGRIARYEFFDKLSQKYYTNFIAVAHNMDDNAETILMNMVRGASTKGQKGILPVNKKICRPLLCVTRCEIEDYLGKLSISHIDDSTNFEDIYTRNFIRNNVFSLLKKINPNVVETLAINAKLTADENDYIECVVNDIFSKISKTLENGIVLDFASDDFHISIKRRLVLKALETLNNGDYQINSSNIENIINLKNEKCFNLGNNLTVRNNYGKLWFVLSKKGNSFSYVLPIDTTLFIKEINKTFYAHFTKKFEKKDDTMFIDFDKIKGPIILRCRKNGDKFSPIGLNGTQSVKDYFINKKIPYFMRDNIPVVECDDGIIGIFPDRIDKNYAISEKTKNILMIKVI